VFKTCTQNRLFFLLMDSNYISTNETHSNNDDIDNNSISYGMLNMF
jgi:hypothetical protein